MDRLGLSSKLCQKYQLNTDLFLKLLVWSYSIEHRERMWHIVIDERLLQSGLFRDVTFLFVCWVSSPVG